MAWQYVTQGAGNNKVSGTALPTSNAANALPAGSLVIVGDGFDNLTTTTPDIATSAQSWLAVVAEADSLQSAAGGGVRAVLRAGVVPAGGIASGTALGGGTLTAAVTAKAQAFGSHREDTLGADPVPEKVWNNLPNTANTITFASATVDRLLVAVTASEQTTAVTPGGNLYTTGATAGGSAVTNVATGIVFLSIFPGVTSANLSALGGTDSVQCAALFNLASPASPDGTLTTTVGNAAAAGGTGSMSAVSPVSATFTTTTGTASAAGGTGSMSVTRNGTLTTTGGNVAASAGTGAFTGTRNPTFTTTPGAVTGAGGTGAFTATRNPTFTTTVGAVVGAGGTGAFTGSAGAVDATFTTTTGNATGAGLTGSLTGTRSATLTTATGNAAAAGLTGSMTGTTTATFTTATGAVAMGGLPGSMTGTSGTTFTTATGDMAARGLTGSMSGTRNVTFTTSVGGVIAVGLTGSMSGTVVVNATLTTTTGNASGSGRTGAFIGSATFSLTVGVVLAGGGSGAMVGIRNVTMTTTAGNVAAAGSPGALIGTTSGTITTVTGNVNAGGGTGTWVTTRSPTFTTSAGVVAAAGGIGSMFSVAATGFTWDELDRLRISSADILTPSTGTSRTVRVFSGRITDMTAAYDPSVPGLSIEVTAADFTAGLNNRRVGDEPWNVETYAARFARVLDLTDPALIPASIVDDGLQPFQLSYRDVDSQPPINVLRDMTTSVDGVLWSATHVTTGPYLYAEDLGARQSGQRLALTAGKVGLVLDPTTLAGALVIDACDVLRDPVQWSQDVGDVVTRVSVTWREQGAANPPEPTDRTETLIDAAAEAAFETTHSVSVSTDLITQADALVIGSEIQARTSGLAWRLTGLVIDSGVMEIPDAAAVDMLAELLDGTTRIGRFLLLENIPGWTPSRAVEGNDVPLYLEGGEYNFNNGRWLFNLYASDARAQGDSMTWAELGPTWTWAQFDPTISWNNLRGVTV